MTNTRFSRRTLLKLAGAASLSALIPACDTFGDDPARPADTVVFDPDRAFVRLKGNPIITPEIGDVGRNINGPSLIRVPDWIENPLGRYYLYFAHHRGLSIRLAYADDLAGPWTLYTPPDLTPEREPGVLHLDQTPAFGHIASPDVHIDESRQRIRMYFHGPLYLTSKEKPPGEEALGKQRTFVAHSPDGLAFEMVHDDPLGAPYFRAFEYDGYTYALAMPGIVYRSKDGLTGFEAGPVLLEEDPVFWNSDLRHSAVLRSGDTLYVFYSRIDYIPEHILLARVDLSGDWMQWSEVLLGSVLKPATVYEGVQFTPEYSKRSAVDQRVHQLRDPAIYIEDDRVYLLYSVAGERGIAIARQV